MVIKALCVALLVAAGVLVPGVPAGAADGLVTFRVQGTLVSLEGATDVAVGEPYVLEYRFNPATAPSSSVPGIFAAYPAVESMTLAIGGVLIASATSGSISVFDQDQDSESGGSTDSYLAGFLEVTELTSIGPLAIDDIVFSVESWTNPVTSVALPAVPPDLSVFMAPGGSLAVSFEPVCDIWTCAVSLLQGSVDSVVVSSGAGSGSGSFAVPGAFGRILTSDGILVVDATDPLGVRIATQAGLATLEMCADMFVVSLAANSDVTYTCGSVTAKVTAGATTIGIGPGGSVTVPSGGGVTVDRLASGSYVVVNKGTTTVTVTRGGVTATLAAGATTASSPQSKDDCKKDGWAAYGVFKNQGSCVSSVAARP